MAYDNVLANQASLAGVVGGMALSLASRAWDWLAAEPGSVATYAAGAGNMAIVIGFLGLCVNQYFLDRRHKRESQASADAKKLEDESQREMRRLENEEKRRESEERLASSEAKIAERVATALKAADEKRAAELRLADEKLKAADEKRAADLKIADEKLAVALKLADEKLAIALKLADEKFETLQIEASALRGRREAEREFAQTTATSLTGQLVEARREIARLSGHLETAASGIDANSEAIQSLAANAGITTVTAPKMNGGAGLMNSPPVAAGGGTGDGG